MTAIKKFFNITENKYFFEISDLTSFITVLNVLFVILGFWWAPFFGICNVFINLTLCVKNHFHINMYIMNIALLILNIFFLTL